MKKFFALILAGLMIFALASCGNTENNETTKAPEKTEGTMGTTATTGGTEKPEDTTAPEDTTSGTPEEPETPVGNALDILNTIWSSYADDEKFAIIGGDERVMDAPGTLDPSNTQTMSGSYYIPEANAAMVDDAASMIHMMNANTFTGGVYHLKDAANVDAFASAVKDNILGAQWICGFPDKVLVISIDDYVIVVFGAEEIIDNFGAKTAAAFNGAEVLYDEIITG